MATPQYSEKGRGDIILWGNIDRAQKVLNAAAVNIVGAER